MTKAQKNGIAVSILIIVVGIAWLLNIFNVLPGVDWLWTGGLGLAGILVLVVGGLNQLTFVAGPFLVVASVMSILRQTGRLNADVEVPILVITFGILLLLSFVLRLPMPESLQIDEKKN